MLVRTIITWPAPKEKGQLKRSPPCSNWSRTWFKGRRPNLHGFWRPLLDLWCLLPSSLSIHLNKVVHIACLCRHKFLWHCRVFFIKRSTIQFESPKRRCMILPIQYKSNSILSYELRGIKLNAKVAFSDLKRGRKQMHIQILYVWNKPLCHRGG